MKNDTYSYKTNLKTANTPCITVALLLILSLVTTHAYAQNFTENLNNDKIGDFPSQWDLLQGSAQVADLYGSKVIQFSNKGTIAPLIDGDDYLGDPFKIEFEIFFDEVLQSISYQSYNIRLWSGIKSGYIKHDEGTLSFRPIKIQRHGMGTHYKDSGPNIGKEYANFITELEGKNPLWRKITVEYNQGTLKTFMNGDLILIIPNYIYNPSVFSIEANSNDGKRELTKAIRNINISAILTNSSANTNVAGQNTADSSSNTGGINNTNKTGNPTITTGDTSGTGVAKFPGQQDAPVGESDINKDNLRDALYGGLEPIPTGADVGWRLKGMDPEKYGNVGIWAVDLSHQNGNNNTRGGAIGDYSFSTGLNTTASGNSSSAMGNNSIASGAYSTAIGHNARSEGNRSIAIGTNTFAAGNNSIALGFETRAEGVSSLAMGANSSAKGDWTIAFGSTTATAEGCTTIGYNNIGAGNPEEWIPDDPIFEVGNGYGSGGDKSIKSNAFTILKNGNIGITTHTPVTKLQITGGSDAKLDVSKSGYMVIGESTGQNLVFDNNELMARNNGQKAHLYLQKDGGSVFVGGSLAHSSDRRLKENIKDLNYGLADILKLQPKSYTWKNRNDTQRSFGLIAQEVALIIPEVVKTLDDKQKTLSLSYTEFIPVLINAIKEQQHILTEHKDALDLLKKGQNNHNDNINTLSAQYNSLQNQLNALENNSNK